MKKHLLKFCIFILVVLMFFCCGCADGRKRNLTNDYFENNIRDVLADSIELEDIFGDENPFEVLFDENKRLNVTLDADLNKLFGYNGEFSFETDIDFENKRGSVNIKLKGISDEAVDLMIYADRGKILLSSDSFFGKGNVYSLEYKYLEKMKYELAKSQLASILGFGENEIYEFCDEYGIDEEYFKKAAQAVREYEEFCEDYLDGPEEIFWDIFEKYHGMITEEEVEINGYKSELLSLEIRIDDDFMQELLDGYMTMYEALASKQCELIKSLLPQKLKNDWKFDAEEAKELMLENLKSRLAQLYERIKLTADLKIYIGKKDGKLRKITACNDEYYVTVYFADEIRVEYSDGNRILSEGRIYQTEDLNSWTIGFEINSADNPYERIEGKFEAIKFENRYNFFIRTMNGDEITAVLFESGGHLAYSENSFEICPEYALSGYESFYPGISLGISSDTFIMKYDNHKSIFKLSETEIYGICDRAVSIFTELSANIGGYVYENSDYIRN